MRYLKYMLLAVLVVGQAAQSVAQTQKRALTHEDYAAWNAITGVNMTADGEKILYSLTPQRGDSKVLIGRTDGGAQDTIYRASKAVFGYGGDYMVAMVKAPFDTTRAMKIAKKKADDMPKDTLVIKKWGSAELKKYAPVVSYKKGEKADWIAWQWDKEKPKKDTAKKAAAKKDVKDPADTSKTKKKVVEKKPQGKKLTITNPAITDSLYTYNTVTDYQTNKMGTYFCFVESEKDSVEYTKVYRFDTQKAEASLLLEAQGKVVKPVVDSLGQVAFLYSADTAKIKTYHLYYASAKDTEAKPLDAVYSHLLTDSTMVVSENAAPYFSADGARLFFGIGKKAKKEEKDSLLAEEKARFDLWSWTDYVLQPQQLLEREREKKRTYTCVYTLKSKKAVRLEDDNIRSVRVPNRYQAQYALGMDDAAYRWENSRNGTSRRDVYLINVSTGERKEMLHDADFYPSLSPNGKYITYFDPADSVYYAIDCAKGTKVNMSKDVVGDVLYNEDDDHIAMKAMAYGSLAWVEGDKYLLVYGKYNIWQLDPSGKTPAKNITKLTPESKDQYISLKYTEMDPMRRYISQGQKMYFTALDKGSKKGGYYSMTYGDESGAKPIIMGEKYYYAPIKAEKAEKYIVRHSTFREYPELQVASSLDMSDAVRLSHANPVMDSLLWGTAELYTWTTADGEKQNGVLYKPENFDPQKKYPVIVYFYETYTDDLYRFYTPAPSYSTVNFPYFVSNDYIVFIPDIKYVKDGYPGRSAEKSIVSGTLALINEGYVNPKAIGIQGQSWGGYQVAYLVTRTDLFAAAGAGAPVSNMTSAYDGIRWESGRSRNIQYERGQSRIGGTLWERPWHYIENSPLFYAPEVNTPIFIMHNDADGAVPWYQGIEYFVALRRLGKPAWLINYNGDSHNLRPASWGNRMDLSRRLGQFFGHYLKGEPMPEWMSEGIPAVKKGETMGY